MLRLIMIAAAAAAGLLAVGALSAAAGNSHGKAVSTLATSTTLKGMAKGDAITSLARATGELKSHAARLNAAPAATQAKSATPAQAQAETDSDTADEATDNDATDNDANDANDATDENAAEAADKAEAAAPATASDQQGAQHDD